MIMYERRRIRTPSSRKALHFRHPIYLLFFSSFSRLVSARVNDCYMPTTWRRGFRVTVPQATIINTCPTISNSCPGVAGPNQSEPDI